MNKVNYASQSASTTGFSSLFLVFYIVFGLVVIILLLVLFYDFYKQSKYEKGKISRSLNMVLLQVLVQKGMAKEGTEEAKKGVKEFAAKASQMFASLYSIKDKKMEIFNYAKGAFISFEIVAINEEILFFLAIPRQLQSLIEKQIHGFYPEASIEETDRYNIFKEGNDYSATEIVLGEAPALPIRTYKEFEEDTLNVLTSAFSKINKDEGAAIQYIIRPTKTKWQKNGELLIKNLQIGKGIKGGTLSWGKIGEGALKFGGELVRAPLKTEQKDGQEAKPKTATPMGEQQIKLISEKMAFVGFETVIRVVVSSPNKAVAKMHLANILSTFSVFNHAIGNKLVKAKGKSEAKIVEDLIFRHFPYNAARNILNNEELASIFHFPNRTIETPGIVWLKSRRAPAPPETPKEGLYLGVNIFRGSRTPVCMKKADRVRHTYIIGKTGTGKSTLMREMMIQDIKNGEGVCYIDPHGTDVEMLLERIPKERVEDVVYFNPADFSRPMALNLLEYTRPEEKTLVVNELLNVFDKLYDLKTTGGPMFEQYFRNAALLVMEDPESGSTLLEIPKVLSDDDFRAFKLSRCPNPVVKNYWLKEAEKAGGEAALANVVPYVSSKLTQFLANDIMRPIIAQQNSSFNVRELMDNRKILLLRLAKGQIGEINAYLLGLIMISKIYLAAMSRADMPEGERKPFYVYIDEFQNFTTDSVASILSEARKYQLALIVAHQYINQLVVNGNTKIRDAVFGNVGTFITYRVGVEDAEFLQKVYEPVFSAYDITNVENNNAYISLLADGTNLKPFSINNYVDFTKLEKNPKLAQAIIELSRLKYGKDREIIEEDIRERA